MDNIYSKGELVQVCTKNDEVVEGRFFDMNSDKTRISLYNVKESPKSLPEDGLQHYYDSEVRKITKLKDTESLAENLVKIKISQKDCEDIMKVSKKYIVINQVDSSFHEALDNLKQYSYVGVSTDGASMGRKCKLPFLVMSTPFQIYIFDIVAMQHSAFEAGLKDILESNHPKKIVHDCRKLSDCLYHKHFVQLNSVFDTQVGDLIITKNKCGRLPVTVRTLKQCLNHYLGLPLNSVEEKFDIVQCTERPLPSTLKETLSKNISYLHRLSEIINDEMAMPFIRGVDCYIENLRSCDDFKAWELCGNINQAPKEFKNAIEY